jgi:GDPmannose 4,6-dehydratase
VGIEIVWRGSGVDEKGYCRRTNRCHIEIDPRYFRPTEVDLLQGDARKAREELGWTPRVGIDELVREMVAADIDELAIEVGRRTPQKLRSTVGLIRSG